MRLAQEIGHSYSQGYAFYCAGWLHQMRREVDEVHEQAGAAIALSTEHGFPFWMALAALQRGWALAEQGESQDGIEQLNQGLATSHAMGTGIGQPYFQSMLAEAHANAGQLEEALAVLADALAEAGETGERWWEAEMYRLRGEWLLALSEENETAAESAFQQALDVARQQGARSLELRAALSLSRLWQQQGKRREAYLTLAEIYNWFTEGFDTPDLQEAAALLDERW